MKTKILADFQICIRAALKTVIKNIMETLAQNNSNDISGTHNTDDD